MLRGLPAKHSCDLEDGIPRPAALDKGHTIVPNEVDVVRAFLAHRLAL